MLNHVAIRAPGPRLHFARLACACLTACASFTAYAADPTLAEARSTLEKWVETRQLISKTRTDWQSDKEMLEQTALVLERELASIEAQMTGVNTNSTQVDKERLEAETLRNSSVDSLEAAKAFAAKFEAQLAQLTPKLPTPLLDILKPLLNRLPTAPADPAAAKLPATERLQVLVGILNELDKFNTAVSVFSERRKNPAGEEIAVETIYIGLGAAYFVNEADDFAGSGTPGPKGWEWTANLAIAPAVRETIRIYRNERPARFVPLPAVLR